MGIVLMDHVNLFSLKNKVSAMKLRNIVFIICMVLIISFPYADAEKNSDTDKALSTRSPDNEGKTIIWNMTTYGDIFNEGDKVGFADGNGTILLSWEYIINIGDTLIIESGVTVFCWSRIVVGGAFKAIGTETNRISFTVNQSKPSSGQWTEILFEPFCDDENSTIKYCNIEYASVGIFCRNSSPSISNNIIRYCSFEGIRCEDNSNPFIINNTISNHRSTGIECINSNPVIEYNTITENRRGAILLDDSSPVIRNNLLLNNGRGIDCLDRCNPIIRYNTIKNDEDWGYDEDYYFIYNWNKSITINAEYNNWGTIDEDEIAAKMGDKVDYDPWLDEDGNEYTSTKDEDDNGKFKITFELSGIIVIIIAIVGVIVWRLSRKRKKTK